jgi:hypothetical protein
MRRKKGKAPSPRHDWSSLDRRMIADDASWAQALAMGSLQNDDWQAIIGLTFLPHCARIVHESYTYLTHKYPAAARTVQLQFGAEIEAARHTVKLLDDKTKLYDGVVADFERIAGVHQSTFWSWKNLSIALRDGRVFTTSRVADFQGAVGPTGLVKRSSNEESHAYLLAYDMGQALPSIASALNIPWPAQIALPLPSGEAPQLQDRRAASYYQERYEPEFPDALKDVLAVIESSVNTSLIIFVPSAKVFADPVFRARLVSTIHALKALTEIVERYPELANRPGIIVIQSILNTPDARHLISPALGSLRNRCMHYGIPSHLTSLSPRSPAYGLVEATTDTTTRASIARY